MTTAGAQFSSQPFTGGTGTDVGAGLLRGETLPGAGGSAPRTPLLANLIDGAGATTPTTTAPAAAPGAVAAAVPGAAGAASTVLGAATATLSSLGSLGQGAAAGGAAGPSLASSLIENQDESKRDEAADRQPGDRLV